MSVDFRIESHPTGRRIVECLGNTTVVGVVNDNAEADALVEIHRAECPDCRTLGCLVDLEFDIDRYVNVSEANVAIVLELLGIDARKLRGSWGAEDFLARCSLALALDSFPEARSEKAYCRHPSGSRLIGRSLPDNYIESRLRQLADLAIEASNAGRDVVWS